MFPTPSPATIADAAGAAADTLRAIDFLDMLVWDNAQPAELRAAWENLKDRAIVLRTATNESALRRHLVRLHDPPVVKHQGLTEGTYQALTLEHAVQRLQLFFRWWTGDVTARIRDSSRLPPDPSALFAERSRFMAHWQAQRAGGRFDMVPLRLLVERELYDAIDALDAKCLVEGQPTKKTDAQVAHISPVETPLKLPKDDEEKRLWRALSAGSREGSQGR